MKRDGKNKSDISVFVPVLTDPAPGSAERIVTALKESVHELRK